MARDNSARGASRYTPRVRFRVEYVVLLKGKYQSLCYRSVVIATKDFLSILEWLQEALQSYLGPGYERIDIIKDRAKIKRSMIRAQKIIDRVLLDRANEVRHMHTIALQRKLLAAKLLEPDPKPNDIVMPEFLKKKGISPLDWRRLPRYMKLKFYSAYTLNDANAKASLKWNGLTWKGYRRGNPYTLFSRLPNQQRQFDERIKKFRASKGQLC